MLLVCRLANRPMVSNEPRWDACVWKGIPLGVSGDALLAALHGRELPSAREACVRNNTGVGYVAFTDRFDLVAALVSRWLPVAHGAVVEITRCTLQLMEDAMEVSGAVVGRGGWDGSREMMRRDPYRENSPLP
jgi:hypothetical protein